MRRLGLIAAIVVTALAAALWMPGWQRADHDSPQVVLWAWERPEDLAFLAGRDDVGVGFLAATLTFEGDQVRESPRLQPLRLPAETAFITVVRLECSRLEPPRLDDEALDRAVEAVVRFTDVDGARGLQVDFDATVGEQPFYRRLLAELRRRRPESFLSITALASWCAGDPWIADLPVDEAVPMLFRMGPDDGVIRRSLAGDRDWQVELCRRSYGVSTDEPWPRLRPGRRLWIFHPRSWTHDDLEGLDLDFRETSR